VLKAYHDLELQTLEVARQKAIHTAELKAINQAHQRIQSSLSTMGQAPADANGTTGDLATQISNLNNRITAIEQLLLIHDAALKDVVKMPPAK
jgi:chromosome segregation ATPase